MLKTNLPRVLDLIGAGDRVLDVGGWAQPLTRADWVVDLMPYETRGWQGRQGPDTERFTRDTWVQRDVCAHEPLPFEDRSFDFVVCSHTLEDIRDPVYLCSELMRVGKAGYLETPSMLAELTFGIESRRYAGYYHHRWLVGMADGRVTFLMKPHFVHSSWRYHLPRQASRRLTASQRVSWLFWDKGFEFGEDIELDMGEHQRRIAAFIRDQATYPELFYRCIPALDAVGWLRTRTGQLARGATRPS